MVSLVVDDDFGSLSEGEKVVGLVGHGQLLNTVASLKGNGANRQDWGPTLHDWEGAAMPGL